MTYSKQKGRKEEPTWEPRTLWPFCLSLGSCSWWPPSGLQPWLLCFETEHTSQRLFIWHSLLQLYQLTVIIRVIVFSLFSLVAFSLSLHLTQTSVLWTTDTRMWSSRQRGTEANSQGWSPGDMITEQRTGGFLPPLGFKFVFSSETEDGELVFSTLCLQAERSLWKMARLSQFL